MTTSLGKLRQTYAPGTDAALLRGIQKLAPWRAGLARGAGGGVTWEAFIADLTETQVIDFDFSKTDRHWQETAGYTIADDAGENIGFASDSALWGDASYVAMLAAQPELITNGTFDSDVSGWTGVTATLAFASAKMRVTATAAFGRANQTFPTTVGRTYRMAGTSTYVSGANQSYIAKNDDGAALAAVTSAGGTTAAADAKALLFPATSATTYGSLGVTVSGAVADFDDISVKKVPGNHGVQSTSSLQGKRQAGGVCRYDGIDDNHLTNFFAQNGAMTLLYSGTIDATIAATQMFLGASGSAANRCWLAVTTSGFIAAGVGSETTSTIVGTTDVRGKTIVAALTFDGSTVKLFLRVDGAATEEYSAAQASTPTTSVPFRIGSYNNNGTAAGFAKVDAKRIAAARKSMTFNEFKSIATRLAA